MLKLVKEIAFGAGIAGLDYAGSLVFPGGTWQIVKGALDPVINRLKEKLGVEDPLDAEHAQDAWSVLDADQTLRDLFDEKLTEAVATLKASGMELSEGDRRLIQAVEGNTEAIQATLKHIQTEGIRIAEPSLDAIKGIVDEVMARRLSSIDGTIFSQLMQQQTVADQRKKSLQDKLIQQLDRTQIRAVELLNQGEQDRALDELRTGLESLEILFEESRGEASLQIRAGYFYKSIAAAFKVAGQSEQAEDFDARAMRIFFFIAYGLALGAKTVHDHVSALNGVGNIHYARGNYTAAIKHFELATRIDPAYCYAWHDMFIAYYALAHQGDIQLDKMRQALEKTRETGEGQPGLGKTYFVRLEELFSEFDPAKIIDALIQEGSRQFDELAELAKNIAPREPRTAVPDERLMSAIAKLQQKDQLAASNEFSAIVDDYLQGDYQDGHSAAIAARYLGFMQCPTDQEAAKIRYQQAVEFDHEDSQAWYELGTIELYKQNMEAAARDFIRAAILASAEHNLSNAARYLSHAAVALINGEGGSISGENIFNGLLVVFAALNDQESLLNTYAWFVDKHFQMGIFPVAKSYAEKAKAVAVKADILSQQAAFSWILGTIHEAEGDRQGATEHYQKAQSLYEQAGEYPMIFTIKDRLRQLSWLATPTLS